MLSFSGLYRVLTLMAILMIPWFLLFRGSPPGAAPAPPRIEGFSYRLQIT